MTSLKTSIKTITYLSDTGCLEIQGASLPMAGGFASIQERFYFSLVWKNCSNFAKGIFPATLSYRST
ncbi:hypothetical protein DD762_25785 [Escherichia coli]|uniref:Nitrite extrusion protein 2 n=1 Tax=Escherichia coli TaxID=562 RepID=A0A2U2UUC8_ECOLX|nr:hypothetical protein DD762_25785 [Escherichia coli]